MAVDVQAVATSYGEEVRRLRTEALVELREAMAELLGAHPEARADLLAELRRLRDKFREQGHEELEDFVLDAMDIVTGWVSPQMRV